MEGRLSFLVDHIGICSFGEQLAQTCWGAHGGCLVQDGRAAVKEVLVDVDGELLDEGAGQGHGVLGQGVHEEHLFGLNVQGGQVGQAVQHGANAVLVV